MVDDHERKDYMVNIPLNSDSTSDGEHSFIFGSSAQESKDFHSILSQDDQNNPEEAQEKARLIDEVLKLQTTLEDLSQRVDSVKEENLKLKSENEVLGTYIDKLMSTSSVFHQTGSKPKNKK